MALFELIIFLPIYVLVSLHTFYIYLDEDHFYIRNFFKKIIIRKEEFIDIQPLESTQINFPRAHYKIYFSDERSYPFRKGEKLKTIFASRKEKAKKIKEEIIEAIRK